jgi:hypothetical protein
LEVAVTPEDAYTSALQLISLRSTEARLGTTHTASANFLDWLVDADADVSRLAVAVLDQLATATVQLLTSKGRVALWAAIAAVPDDERKPVEQRQAAKLLLAHAACNVPVLCDMGENDFERTAIVVTALDRVAEVVLALVDVWIHAHAAAAALALDALEPSQPNYERKTT